MLPVKLKKKKDGEGKETGAQIKNILMEVSFAINKCKFLF